MGWMDPTGATRSWRRLPVGRRLAMVWGGAPMTRQEARAALDFADYLRSVRGLVISASGGLVGAVVGLLISVASGTPDPWVFPIVFAAGWLIVSVPLAVVTTRSLRRRADAMLTNSGSVGASMPPSGDS